ncbi:hypothetical protein Pla110_03650 [Polystyrenella longa]|uniref:SLBB domain protein n=1 Tax=Polystyrenella longa TaxID=2528007 RepID=A0A518CHG5_9PLAN|nr:hypothetical protein [Polystyrenella longa]QDU78661.1 hypothetical protein Pla110_03650 [Polystyrenella longa]
MILRRLLLAFLVMATPCSWIIAQEQATSGPQFVPLEQTSTPITKAKSPSFAYYSVSGSVQKPGVYEFEHSPVTVQDLINKAGEAGLANAAIVRPLTRDQIEPQMQRPSAQSPPLPLLQSSHIVESPDEIVHPGDLVVFQSIRPAIQQTVHQPAAPAANGKVKLILANLIGRPVHAEVDASQANVLSLAQHLGIPQENVEKNAIIVLRSRQNPEGTAAGHMVATEPLPSGTILLFDPTLVHLEQLNSESIEQLTQTHKPIRVATNPHEESRTDVPQSNLMTEYQDESAYPNSLAESASTIAPPMMNAPNFVDQPTPAPEEEMFSAPMVTAQVEAPVEMLAAPPEGAGMYDGEGSNLVDVEAMLARNGNSLPAFDDTPAAPVNSLLAENDLELAEASAPKARSQASLWVISVLVILIASVLGFYLYNTRSTAPVKTAKTKQKLAPQRQPVKRPNMLDNIHDPKVAQYRQKVEQKKKMFAASTRREEELQIDALINDFLPVQEEEMVISRTFNLPGIGQSFRIDPASTELQGPHFRQAAKVNRKSTEKVTANVGTEQSRPVADRPDSSRPASGRPANQAYHTIHKGGDSHFGSGK